MAALLKLKPTNVQATYRPSFSPPNYDLIRSDIALSLAKELALAYGLNSTNISFNQNATSGQFISFRYAPPSLPDVAFRYFDTHLGVDQADVVFQNPATMSELKSENMKIWSILLGHLNPPISQNYFEAVLHCATEEGDPKKFFDAVVSLPSGISEGQKGFSYSIKDPKTGVDARILLEASAFVPNGIYVNFACVVKTQIANISALENLFDQIVMFYRELQSLVSVQILEPS